MARIEWLHNSSPASRLALSFLGQCLPHLVNQDGNIIREFQTFLVSIPTDMTLFVVGGTVPAIPTYIYAGFDRLGVIWRWAGGECVSARHWIECLGLGIGLLCHSIYHPIRLINKHGQPPRPPPPHLLNVPPPTRVSPPRRRINSMESSVCNLGECVPLWPASHPSNYDLLRLVRGDRGDQLDLSKTHIGLSCICLSSVTSPSCLFSLLSPRNKTRTRRLFGWRQERDASSSSPPWTLTDSCTWRHRTSWTVWWSRSRGHGWRGRRSVPKISIR